MTEPLTYEKYGGREKWLAYRCAIERRSWLKRAEKDREKSRIYGRTRRKKKPRTNRDRARSIYKHAIADGRIVRGTSCQLCGIRCHPHGHHPDYSRPFDVVWVCSSCHGKLHRKYEPIDIHKMKSTKQKNTWERKKLGIRFEQADCDGWEVWKTRPNKEGSLGFVFIGWVARNDSGKWTARNGKTCSLYDSPHRTRLEAAKALLGEAR